MNGVYLQNQQGQQLVKVVLALDLAQLPLAALLLAVAPLHWRP